MTDGNYMEGGLASKGKKKGPNSRVPQVRFGLENFPIFQPQFSTFNYFEEESCETRLAFPSRTELSRMSFFGSAVRFLGTAD